MKTPIILIADDETNIRLMLRMTLQSEGYTVREAVDGREALKAIEREVPDLMILDLSMPQVDGLGVLRELKGLRPDRKPRVIVLTAYGSIPTAVKATQLGALDFLEKPVSPDEVRESVAQALTVPVGRNPVTGQDDITPAGGYVAVLDQIRKALRLARYTDAETLLMKAADLAERDPAYFNLLGVLYESQREWRLARKFYTKAVKLDRHYEPARQNIRRLYELERLGTSSEAVTLGDEMDLWFARLPQASA